MCITITITVKPLFERHLYLNTTSNRTPLLRKGRKIERLPLIERHFDEISTTGIIKSLYINFVQKTEVTDKLVKMTALKKNIKNIQ